MIALAVLFTFIVGALSIASLAVNGLAFLSREELKEIQKKNELEQEKRNNLPKTNIYKTDIYEKIAYFQYAREYPEECAILTADRGDGIKITDIEKVWKSENYQRIYKEVKRGQ